MSREIQSGVVSRNIKPAHAPKMSKAEFAKQMAKMRERDSELVAGIFENKETPGGTLVFNFKQYPGDDFVTYSLTDGERYKIPRGVARHLSTGCYTKEYKHLKGEEGQTGIRAAYNDGILRADSMQAMRKVYRFGFNSLEFMDDDNDLRPSNIVEVGRPE